MDLEDIYKLGELIKKTSFAAVDMNKAILKFQEAIKEIEEYLELKKEV